MWKASISYVSIYTYIYIYVGVQVHRVCFHVFRFKLLFLLRHCLVLFKVCAPQKALLILETCSMLWLWPWLLGWWLQICLVFHPFRWWFRLTLHSWDGLTYIYTYHKVYIYIYNTMHILLHSIFPGIVLCSNGFVWKWGPQPHNPLSNHHVPSTVINSGYIGTSLICKT